MHACVFGHCTSDVQMVTVGVGLCLVGVGVVVGCACVREVVCILRFMNVLACKRAHSEKDDFSPS